MRVNIRSLIRDLMNPYIISGLIIVLFVVFLALFSELIAPYDPTRSAGPPLAPPSWSHIMGTDNLGYDVWSRIVYGSRTILMVVSLSLLISSSVGIVLGLISGYTGGLIDRILSFTMDAIYAFPSLILAIALAVALGPGPLNAAIAIAVVYIPSYFRMIRGQVLSIKNEAFIEIAKVLGIPVHRILLRHILPHLTPTIMVVFSMNSADAVLTEASLSFLGLSVQPPTPDWGYDLYKGRDFILSGYWWLIFFPGLMITLLALGMAMISEGVSDLYERRRS
ncbi:MAG: ABC transporter permease [Sulfolobales archaeon]